MSKRLFIYCEGQTEEMFVERLLRNRLIQHGVKVERPKLAATSLDPKGQRGGFVNWDAIEFDLGEIFAENRDPDMKILKLRTPTLFSRTLTLKRCARSALVSTHGSSTGKTGE
ncbi:MAG: DUF4276 family protein [Verrucomicrobia bacterium]|nr:MAG: DUF4276 family protein [Verrucomicrobiota bacterium]